MEHKVEDTVTAKFAGPYVAILEALCGQPDFRAASETLLEQVALATGCESAALRVHDRRDDYPYFIYRGFDHSFVESENDLCCRGDQGFIDRDERGVAALCCMCGAVLRGEIDPAQPFSTKNGSFWTNSTTELLSGKSGGDLGRRTRNTCNAAGYESVALVPLRAGDRIVGLLQTNSRQKGRFDGDVLAFLEEVGRHTGAAIEATWRHEELGRMAQAFEDRQRRTETMIAMGEMASTLAHEVKNPLAGMMLSASRLKKALKADGTLQPLVEHLTLSINSLNETVNQVTRGVRGPDLDLRPVRAADVLESALELVAPRAANQGVQVAREVDAEGIEVLADAGFLRQAFLNLIINALEAMPEGGILHVSVKNGDDDRVEVVVGDTGPGIDPAEAERLFEPFVTGKPTGTGLGLGIVRRALELHSGSVKLRPRSGGGTEAAVTLPVNGKAS